MIVRLTAEEIGLALKQIKQIDKIHHIRLKDGHIEFSLAVKLSSKPRVGIMGSLLNMSEQFIGLSRVEGVARVLPSSRDGVIRLFLELNSQFKNSLKLLFSKIKGEYRGVKMDGNIIEVNLNKIEKISDLGIDISVNDSQIVGGLFEVDISIL